MSADNIPTALFQEIQALFNKEDLEDVQRSVNKVASYGTGPEEMPGKEPSLVIREQFEPLGLEEVERVLRTVSSAICSLDLYPSWLVKVAWGGGVILVGFSSV